MANSSYTKVRRLCIRLTQEICGEDFAKYPGNVEICDDGRTLIVKETYSNSVGFDVYNRDYVIRYSFMKGWAND